MRARLILAIFSTLLEEAGLAAIVLLGLPYLGIHNFPLAGLIALMVAWGVLSIFSYRAGSRALMRKPVVGLPAMLDSKGRVVSPLTPKGVIKVGNELWEATSAGRKIKAGEEVTVVGQDRLRLIVRKSSTVKLEKT